MVELEIDTHIGDVADLFIEDLRRQPELRNVCPHQAAGRLERFENRYIVAERPEVVCDGQGRATGTDERHLLAIAGGALWQPLGDVLSVVGGDAL